MSQFWLFPRTRSLGAVGIHSVSSPPIDLLAETEPTERKNGMNSVLRRSNLGGARQLVHNHEQTGTVAPSENGRLPPVLAHQLASAHEKSEKRGVQAARNAPSEDRKCWQLVELGIHGLRSWGRNWSRKVRETRSLRNRPGIISRSFRNHGPSCGKVSSPCHRADRRTGLQPGPRRETCGPADGGAERLDGATHFVAASACKGSTLTGTERASGSD